jgi:hypothetical protein
MNRWTAVISAALASVLLLGGCGKGPSKADAIRFNDALVDANDRIAKAGSAFGDAAAAAVGGGIIEVGKVKREFENLNDAVSRSMADVRGLKVPETPAAKAFYGEHQALLKKQELIVKEDCRMILKALDDPLLTPQQRMTKIRPIASYLGSLDRDEVSSVKRAQAAFAREQGFELKKK